MAKEFRLFDQSIVDFLATSDPEPAKKTYGGALALPLVALVYDAHGTVLRVNTVLRADDTCGSRTRRAMRPAFRSTMGALP